jgi:LmbE family N-acetylglucosaminyl deacetylase
MNERVLVVAAHPDDEVLGCGATIAKKIANGSIVKVLIMGEGVLSRTDVATKYAVDYLDRLRSCSIKANKCLGVDDLEIYSLPDNRFDSLPRLEIVKRIEAVVSSFNPCCVFTHHSGDLNIDHRRVNEAVITACRPLPGSSAAKIYSFEVQSSTDWSTQNHINAFMANHYVDIEGFLELKLEALRYYDLEMRDWPHSRSIKAVEYLARLRGSQVGRNAAEAFSLLRSIE